MTAPGVEPQDLKGVELPAPSVLRTARTMQPTEPGQQLANQPVVLGP